MSKIENPKYFLEQKIVNNIINPSKGLKPTEKRNHHIEV
jgi:hypothetical protein